MSQQTVWIRPSRTYVEPDQCGDAVSFHPCHRPSRLLTFIVCAVAVLSFAYLVAEKVS